ncbi:MAG TPA: hypothetical protein VMJ31_10480 [Methylocystis sp.]|nr:hypothetical protein [Methylocystis sp.]
MKTIAKLALATLLAAAAAAGPAFAQERDTLAERNAYYAARQHQQAVERHMQRARQDVSGADAYAADLAPVSPNDFGILSQH